MSRGYQEKYRDENMYVKKKKAIKEKKRLKGQRCAGAKKVVWRERKKKRLTSGGARWALRWWDDRLADCSQLPHTMQQTGINWDRCNSRSSRKIRILKKVNMMIVTITEYKKRWGRVL